MMEDKKCACGADATKSVCMEHKREDGCMSEKNMCDSCAEDMMQEGQ